MKKIISNKLNFSHRASNTGFTLIELLVVIAIIGILASVVLVSLNSARGAARDAKRISEIRQVMTSLEMFRNANNGQYPCRPDGINPTPVNTLTTTCSDLRPYLGSELPADPTWTGVADYRYSTNTARNGYALRIRYDNGDYCRIERGVNAWSTAPDCF